MKNKVGKPLKFRTVKKLQAAIDEYFANTAPDEVTVTGLAIALDTTRETLMDYEHRDEYADAVKKAKLRVQHEYEKALRRQGRAGDIFALKNFGWTDKQEVDQHNSGELTVNWKQ